MKKAIIGAFVGAILVFGWQSVAHTVMHHHDAGYKTVPNQDSVIAGFTSIFKEEGQYFVPMIDLITTSEEREKWMKSMEGKPWAMVVYHSAMKGDMTMQMIRSFFTAFLCVLLLIGILGKFPGSFGNIFLKCLGAGFFTFMFVWYNQNIWMFTPWEVVQGELIDSLVAWGLCGLWLGQFLKKK